MSDRSLFDRVGGEAAIKPAVALLYQRVLSDPALSSYFDGVDLHRLRAHQRAFVTAALGGPELFVGRPLDAAHHGLHIDDAAFDGVVDHLVCALRDLGVSDDIAAEVATELEPLRSQIVT
jgi:hemoglobin